MAWHTVGAQDVSAHTPLPPAYVTELACRASCLVLHVIKCLLGEPDSLGQSAVGEGT